MKKATNKLMSFLAAFAMVLSVLVAPFTSANAAGDQGTKTVTVHSILQTLDKFNAQKDGRDLFPGQTGIDGSKYNGKELTINEYFGEGSKEVDGVFFAWQNENGQWIDSNGKVVNSVDKALSGKTSNGSGFNFNTEALPKGSYRIVEVKEKSTVNEGDAKKFQDRKAVPIEISLPLEDNNGTITDAHVYPKYTVTKPKMDKNFDKTIEEEKSNSDGFDAEIQLDNNGRTKETVNRTIGDEVPYQVETEIPQSAQFTQLVWTDTMDKGLTMGNELKVTIRNDEEGANEVTLEQGKHYNFVRDDRGFQLAFTQTGLELVRERAKSKTQIIRLEYKATLNEDAKIDDVQANDIKLNYKNRPSHTFDTPPVNPKDGEISLSKSWASDGNKVTAADKDVTATFTLFVKNEDGQFVPAKDNDGKNIEKTVNYEENFTHTFTGLDDTKEYKIVESNIKGYAPEYVVEEENGQVTIVNQRNKVTPRQNKIVVNKTWAGNNVPEDANASVVWNLYSEDGKQIIASVLVRQETAKGTVINTGVNGANGKNITFTVGDNLGGTFENLDDGTTYQVRESSVGYNAKYVADASLVGSIKVDNTEESEEDKPE